MSISTLNLNAIKERIVETILSEQMSSGEISPEDIKRLRKEYLEKFQSSQLATRVRTQSGVTSADDFNDTAFEMYADLLATFKYINELDRIIKSHSELNVSAVNTMTAMLQSVEETLSAYEQTLAEQNRINCHVIHFNDGSSTSTNVNQYTDRFGQDVEPSTYCQVDVMNQNLSLPYLRRQNMITYSDDVSAGYVQLSKQLCGLFSYGTSEGKKLERITDTSFQTYWSDTLFTDEPIRISFDSVRPTDETKLKDYYYGIQNGALFELEFVFESISRLNELSLVPYSQFPFELVAIRYKTTDDIDEPLKEVLAPDLAGNKKQRLTLERPITVQFEEINCKRLYVICNQVHYTKESLLVDSLELFKNALWMGMNEDNNDPIQVPDETAYYPVIQDRLKKDAIYRFMSQLAEKAKNVDLEDILLKSNQTLTPLTKYRYQYGFYNISPNFVEFEETGVFVTTPLKASGNIHSIQLEADETLAEAGNEVLTDIEYYISLSGSNESSEWIPILPINRDEVKCERLLLTDNYCPLRFPAVYVLSVQSSGQLLIEGQDYQLLKDSLDQIVGIKINNFSSSLIYTVRYVPTDEPKTLTLIEEHSPKLNNLTEIITANGSSYYDLSEYPYQEEMTTTTEVKLFDKETGVILSESAGEIMCVTDYLSTEDSHLNFDPSLGVFQYYTYKNQIFFNQEIPSRYDIEINYQHSMSSFCVKAILRRNSREYKWLTPRLSELRLKVDTVN